MPTTTDIDRISQLEAQVTELTGRLTELENAVGKKSAGPLPPGIYPPKSEFDRPWWRR